MAQETTRIGMIGYGQIGAAVHQLIEKDPGNGMELVFVHDQETARLANLPQELVLDDLGDYASRKPDLVVEMAHKDVTRDWGLKILETTNYMPVSVTTFADAEMEQAIREVTARHGTRCFVPHGGVVGMDALYENRDVWESVDITMKKPPHNVDCAAAGVNPDDIKVETVLYDGPTRGVCPKFPRNVNTHAAIALAGIGFDRTHSLLVVNPEWNFASVGFHAKGPGVNLQVERAEEIVGVTGASTPASIYNSVQTVGATGSGIHMR